MICSRGLRGGLEGLRSVLQRGIYRPVCAVGLAVGEEGMIVVGFVRAIIEHVAGLVRMMHVIRRHVVAVRLLFSAGMGK